MRTSSKIITIASTVAVLAIAVFVFFKFCFVLGEGVKAGELNMFVYKGWIWKTYEGRLIQAGFKGANKGAIQSNEFNFSVVDGAVAEKLMRCSGKNVELRYKEYNGMLPWRGMQRYVVYEILSVSDPSTGETSALPPLPIEQ
ncbi:MAG: hypothetical protein MJY44_01745 [Bacteroidales bacterium]|nr:hypothetical protein [Bacteroidales bacterium]